MWPETGEVLQKLIARQITIEMQVARQETDRRPAILIKRIFTKEFRFSGTRVDKPQHDTKGCRFASAVRTEVAENFTWFDGKTDLSKCAHIAEVLRQVAHHERPR